MQATSPEVGPAGYKKNNWSRSRAGGPLCHGNVVKQGKGVGEIVWETGVRSSVFTIAICHVLENHRFVAHL